MPQFLQRLMEDFWIGAPFALPVIIWLAIDCMLDFTKAKTLTRIKVFERCLIVFIIVGFTLLLFHKIYAIYWIIGLVLFVIFGLTLTHRQIFDASINSNAEEIYSAMKKLTKIYVGMLPYAMFATATSLGTIFFITDLITTQKPIDNSMVILALFIVSGWIMITQDYFMKKQAIKGQKQK